MIYIHQFIRFSLRFHGASLPSPEHPPHENASVPKRKRARCVGGMTADVSCPLIWQYKIVHVRNRRDDTAVCPDAANIEYLSGLSLQSFILRTRFLSGKSRHLLFAFRAKEYTIII